MKRTGCCGVSWVDVGCVSRMTIAVGWRRKRTSRTCGPAEHCDDRDARHLVAVAPPVDCPQVDLREGLRTARCARRDPSVGRADGDGQSDVGLHAAPGRARERRPSLGSVDDSPDPESGRPAAGPAAPDVLADVLKRARTSWRTEPIVRCRPLQSRQRVRRFWQAQAAGSGRRPIQPIAILTLCSGRPRSVACDLYV